MKIGRAAYRWAMLVMVVGIKIGEMPALAALLLAMGVLAIEVIDEEAI